jgi:hypothetical protein
LLRYHSLNTLQLISHEISSQKIKRIAKVVLRMQLFFITSRKLNEVN